MRNKFTDKELETLLKNLVILVDSREQENSHIIKHFDSKKIRYRIKKIDQGDYSCLVESNEETKHIIGNRDIYFDNDFVIERKNSLDELAGNLSKDRNRIEDEMNRIKSKGIKLLFMLEDENGQENLRKGNYRSKYEPKALYGSIKSFESRYNFTISYISKTLIGAEIYAHCYYNAREYLK